MTDTAPAIVFPKDVDRKHTQALLQILSIAGGGFQDARLIEVPVDRLNTWHVVIIYADSYQMAHPFDCILNQCEFDRIAQRWEDIPVPPGVYRWDEAGGYLRELEQ